MNNTMALILPSSPYFTLFSNILSGLIGIIIGGIITLYIEYAKTKAMMKWETKYLQRYSWIRQGTAWNRP